MQSLTQPTLLLKPFAQSGDRNDIPLVNNNLSNPQLADLTNGFPEITSLPPSVGGLPPERKDFNALGYLTTSYDWFYQAGGTFTFNQTICDAIGGYPLNARLWYTDSNGVSCVLRSKIANNTNNFLTDPSVIGETGSGKPWEVENFKGVMVKGFTLLEMKWSDHIINDVSWLRSDTFSWQSGLVYTAVYQHLVADINGKTARTETVGSYTITYYLADDGHKVVLANQETTVQNIYTQFGVAWYYILDTTNQRFKLPRIDPSKEALLLTAPTTTSSTANNYAPVSLYWNVAGSSTRAYGDANGAASGKRMIGINQDGNTQQVVGYQYANTYAGSLVAPRNLVTNLSSATSIYKGNKYLYFYVGQYSQTATEQTAGLNTELFNEKLDIDVGNATSSTKQTIVGWDMPDYTRPTVITSSVNSTNGYTATQNCFIRCYCSALANNTVNPTIKMGSYDYTILQRSANNQFYNTCFWIMPLAKGQNIQCDSYTGVTWAFQMFPTKG